MTPNSRSWTRKALGLAALALLGGGAGRLAAADAPLPPAPPAGMVMAEAPAEGGCASCSGDPAGRPGILHGLHLGIGHGHKVTVPQLCPGACFGYFQTKWTRWEDACSHYYQGVGVSDGPKPPIPALTPVAPGKAAAGTAPMPLPVPKPETKRPAAFDPMPTPMPMVVPPTAPAPGTSPLVPPVPPTSPLAPVPPAGDPLKGGSKFSP